VITAATRDADCEGVEATTAPRRLRLRYPATCAVCGKALPPRTEAVWDSASKRATCLGCAGASADNEAGASAHARFDELQERRVRKARAQWGAAAADVAREVAAQEPSLRAWQKGADGESRLAAWVEREVGDAVAALHDRVIPGAGQANIDHLFVASTGVWVVDAKTWKGKVECRTVGPLWHLENRVFVGDRDRTDKLVPGFRRQLLAVRAALHDDAIPVHAAVCFVDSDWGLLARPFDIAGITMLHPGALRSRLKKAGEFDRSTIELIAARLREALPPAAA
jgi:hypothetical protein